jgi:uncharacterized protein (DUF58 family)
MSAPAAPSGRRGTTQRLARSAVRGVRARSAGLTALGWGMVVAAVVTLVVGRRYGWAELVVAGCVLAVAVLVSAAMTVGRSHYAVDVDLADQSVTVGERAMGRIGVRNVGRRRLLPARIELPVGVGSASFALPSMAAGAEHEEVYAIPTTRRAVVVVGPVRSVRADPLGIARREVLWTDPVELYVHPVTVSLDGTRAGLLRDLEGQSTRTISDDDMSFHALREYIPGDDRRSIHWRTSARTGTLMVRQFEDTRRTHTALAVSTDTEDYRDEEELELAVSTFASLGTHVVRDGLEITVLAGTDRLRTQTPRRLLDDCASITPAPRADDAVELTRTVARNAPTASMAVVVTGSVPSRAALRSSSAHLPAGLRTIFVQCEPGAEVSLRTQGTLSVSTLGAIEDLPRLLRQLVTG